MDKVQVSPEIPDNEIIITYDYLERILTGEAIAARMISPIDFLEIKEVEILAENKLIRIVVEMEKHSVN